MPPTPIIFKPGIDVQSTPALNAASWNESGNIRFFQGLVQKAGGFEQFAAQVANGGRPTALRAWTALSGIAELAIGSQERISLYASTLVSDITPLTKLSQVPISISTTADSQTVTIQDPLDQPMEGDWFLIRAPITVGGIILDGVYRVDSVIDPTHFTITAAVAASSTVVNGGAARQFITLAGNTTVTINLMNHGLFSGQVVFISEPVMVGGLTLSGNYIATATNADVYTIEAASPAITNDTVDEHGGNLALAFLTGLIRATSATVEPFDEDASHISIAIGADVVPYVSGGVLTYAPGDLLTMIGGTGALGTVPVFEIVSTTVVTVAINAVGSGGTPGAHTFRGTTGPAGTYVEFSATVAPDGTLTGATPVITNPGQYFIDNPTLVGQPIVDLTDGSLTGATINVGMWPDTLDVTTPGAMIVFPANPVGTANSGTGRGATLNVGWDFGYAIGDVLTLVGGFGEEEPTFSVVTLNVARVIIMAPGSGGTPGVHTFRGTTGTGTPFEFTAEIAGDGTLTGAEPDITVAGSYTVAPTLMGEPVTDITDGSLVGATVNVSMWPATVSLLTAGSMTTIPDNPAATSDSGDGSGAELNVTWDYSGGSQNNLSVEYITLDNWGEFLVAIPAKRPVYIWRPQDTPALPLQNVGSAPQSNITGFVAIQQQILVLCGTVNFGDDLFDPMLVRWSNAGDYTDFIPTSANQAGSVRLQLGSTIVAGLSVASRNLIWTDLGVYAMQYQGLPFVFSLQPIGVNCGLVGPHAVGTLGDTTLWMSQNQFYVIAGGSPQAIPCSIWDQVFPNADKANFHLVTCATNAYYGEATFYVPQTDGTVTAARLQVQSGLWDYTTIDAGTTLDRSAWVDQNVFGAPMGADPAGNVYRQETTNDADGEVLEARLLSGLAMIAEGDQHAQLFHIYPDIKFGPDGLGPGTVNMKVYIYKDMQAPPRAKGPYPINRQTRRIPCRGRGKGIQFEFTSSDLGNAWRLGRVEYDAIPDGNGG